ncbi:hypothetical protein K469DRAFT_91965 [Zopfia rhizophila CBS 207.26]|uniref:Uncharacterized protein n=1 Tax=Zopfia rhizophila CBS 207.26 TaxID=1314779 RepID=A0A6A6EDN9_9PEZI|nr:hypothetical protein K469DRAFT_91965 [Zopfia rhizophila CBS 207.26]
MAHNEDFCGDRLRLTAFLRVIENMPRRPSRFHKRLRSSNQQTDKSQKDDSAPSGHAQSSVSLFLAQSDESLALSEVELVTSPLERRSSGGKAHDSYTNEYPNDPVSLPPEEDIGKSVGDHIDDTATMETTDLREPPITKSRKRKGLVLYKVNTKPQDDASIKVTGGHKRRLPVNGLALVRTSTADGLPDRAVRCSLLAQSHTDIL